MPKEWTECADNILTIPESLSGFSDEILRGCQRALIFFNDHKSVAGVADSCVPHPDHYPENGPCRTAGERVIFQLNLETLPEFVTMNRLPKTGMVFVVLDDSTGEKSFRVIHDPRPVSCLEYTGSLPRHNPNTLQTVWTPPFYVIDERFAWLEYLEDDFNTWVYAAFPFYRRKGFLQIGGNMHSCQIFDKDDQDKFVAQMTGLDWLYDAGEVTLYYDEKRGFYVRVHTH